MARKAVILARGLTEETETSPKSMIEIGGRPILWHIMALSAVHGINEFIICLGYRGSVLKKCRFNDHIRMAGAPRLGA